jgi:hypothetical protein
MDENNKIINEFKNIRTKYIVSKLQGLTIWTKLKLIITEHVLHSQLFHARALSFSRLCNARHTLETV